MIVLPSYEFEQAVFNAEPGGLEWQREAHGASHHSKPHLTSSLPKQ